MVSKSGMKIDTTGWSLSLRYNGSCRPVVAQSKEFSPKAPTFVMALLDSDHRAFQKFIVHPLA
jgi:hypothetical protein